MLIYLAGQGLGKHVRNLQKLLGACFRVNMGHYGIKIPDMFFSMDPVVLDRRFLKFPYIRGLSQ